MSDKSTLILKLIRILILVPVVLWLMGKYVYGVLFFDYPAIYAYMANLAIAGIVGAMMTIWKIHPDRRECVINLILTSTVLFIPFRSTPKWYVVMICYTMYAATSLVLYITRRHK